MLWKAPDCLVPVVSASALLLVHWHRSSEIPIQPRTGHEHESALSCTHPREALETEPCRVHGSPSSHARLASRQLHPTARCFLSTFALCAVQNYCASLARAARQVKRAKLPRASASLRGCLHTKNRRAIPLPDTIFRLRNLARARTRAMA